jgi:alanyl-tRNA synthetase
MDYNENPKSYYPPMHTAEHILNGTMDQMFKRGRAFSAHIEKKKSKCDYHFNKDLTAEEIKIIEEKVNSVIKSNLPVKENFMSREEAAEIFNLDRLPDEAGSNLRVISIGDYDKCLCSGPHVNSTKEIGGSFKIISTNYENGILRIRFKIISQTDENNK